MTDQIIARAAIRTRFHGPTNARGARISAYREGWADIPAQKIFLDYEYGMNGDENHANAAQQFLDKFNPGNVLNCRTYCFDGDYFWTWKHSPND